MNNVKHILISILVIVLATTTVFAARTNPGEAKLMVRIVKTMRQVAQSQVPEFSKLNNKGKTAAIINALASFDFKMPDMSKYEGRNVAYMTLAEDILAGMTKQERSKAFENAMTLLGPATNQDFSDVWPTPEMKQEEKKKQQQKAKALQMARASQKRPSKKTPRGQKRKRKIKQIYRAEDNRRRDPRAVLVEKLMNSSERALSNMGQQTVAPASLF